MKKYSMVKHLWRGKKEMTKSAGFSNRESAFLFSNPMNQGGEKMRRLNRRGQSTLEYAIIWTAIVGAILFGATRYLKPAVDNAVSQASGKITTEVGKLVDETGD